MAPNTYFRNTYKQIKFEEISPEEFRELFVPEPNHRSLLNHYLDYLAANEIQISLVKEFGDFQSGVQRSLNRKYNLKRTYE